MCYYRLYIFLDCGHSTLSLTPIRSCAAVRTKRLPRKWTRYGKEKRQKLESAKQPTTLPIADSIPGADVECELSTHPNLDIATSIDEPLSPVDHVMKCPPDCEEALTHPSQSFKIHASCTVCIHAREALLTDLKARIPQVRFENWRWKVKYLSPVPKEAQYTGWGVKECMGAATDSWKTMADEGLGVHMEQTFSVEPQEGKGEGKGRERDMGE